ncbi:hypothetical protein GCM10027416_22130 [Okibacterium endophyticum]
MRRAGTPIALAALTTLAAVIVVAAAVIPSLLPQAPAVTTAQGPSDATTGLLTELPFSSAWDRIEDTATPFVVAVLGDSTGDEAGEWVDLAFTELAELTGRTLVMHPWDKQTSGYLSEIRRFESAPNAPLVVWNGSASGETAEYSLAHLDTILPERPDVVIVNHGLNNVREPTQTAAEFTALIRAIEQRWTGTVGYAAILENPRFDEWSEAHRTVIDTVTEWAKSQETVRVIDVFAAYIGSGREPSLLLPDLLHPSVEGSRLTADVVLAAITG